MLALSGTPNPGGFLSSYAQVTARRYQELSIWPAVEGGRGAAR